MSSKYKDVKNCLLPWAYNGWAVLGCLSNVNSRQTLGPYPHMNPK